MPWCDPCDRFYNPNTLLADGSCPRCSTVLGDDHQHDGDHGDDHSANAATIPWHFWLVLALVAIYLGWRVIEGVLWVVDQIF